MKKKIYNIILIILALILLVVISIIAFKRINNQIKEKELINTVADIKVKLEEIKESENDEKTITKYKGYDIVGIIEIPKINIEYPIINQTSDETMALSITKFWGNNVNDIGNFSGCTQKKRHADLPKTPNSGVFLSVKTKLPD